jgi:hypothetical protein
MPNIWAIDDESADDDDTGSREAVVSDHMEDELEKPSFLRRLANRHKNDDETTPEQADDNSGKK